MYIFIFIIYYLLTILFLINKLLKKKMAIMFFGISYLENYNYRNSNIDFRLSVDNYKEFIFNYFKNKYNIDVFIATNIIDDDIYNQIIQIYNPIKIKCCENLNTNLLSRQHKITSVIQLCKEYSKEYNINYDLCLITRFDLLFKIPLNQISFNYNTINITSQLNIPNAICDNFYLLPFNYLSSFYNIINKNEYNHFIKSELDKICNIHFFYNQHTYVNSLSFYKIIRTANISKDKKNLISFYKIKNKKI